MNIDRLLLLCLTLLLLNILFQHHRSRLKWLWQRTKDHLPRKWKPKSPRDCAGCLTRVTLVALPDPTSVVPWSECKSSAVEKSVSIPTALLAPILTADILASPTRLFTPWSAMVGLIKPRPSANCAVKPVTKPSQPARVPPILSQNRAQTSRDGALVSGRRTGSSHDDPALPVTLRPPWPAG